MCRTLAYWNQWPARKVRPLPGAESCLHCLHPAGDTLAPAAYWKSWSSTWTRTWKSQIRSSVWAVQWVWGPWPRRSWPRWAEPTMVCWQTSPIWSRRQTPRAGAAVRPFRWEPMIHLKKSVNTKKQLFLEIFLIPRFKWFSEHFRVRRNLRTLDSKVKTGLLFQHCQRLSDVDKDCERNNTKQTTRVLYQNLDWQRCERVNVMCIERRS